MTPQILCVWYVLALTFFSFFGLFFINLFASAARRMKSVVKTQFLQDAKPSLYFRLQRYILKETKVETLLFCTTTVAHILRIVLFLICFAYYFRDVDIASYFMKEMWLDAAKLAHFVAFLLALIFLFIICLDLLPRLFAYYFPDSSLKVSAPIACLFLILFSPISFVLYKLMRLILPQGFLSPFAEYKVSTKEKLFE